MKTTLAYLLLLLPALVFAQKEKYGLPEFDNSLKTRFQRDSGGYDERRLRTGFWAEYSIDSTEKRGAMQSKDESYGVFTPHKIVLLCSKGRYKEGGREGEWKSYRSYSYTNPVSWQLYETYNYKDGKLSGAWHCYSKTGKVMEECGYKDGYPDGIHKSYYPNGKLKKSIPMEKGYVNGVIKYYDDKGRLVVDMMVKNNYFDGPQHYYHTNGKIFTTRIYSFGKLIKITELQDRNGNPLDPGNYEDGYGTLKIYDDLGALLMSVEYKRGLRSGKTTHYWPNGNVRLEYQMVSDTANGIEKSYDEQGRLRSEAKLVKGSYEGPKKSYYPNGKLWTERVMKNDRVWNVISLTDTSGKALDFGSLENGTGLLINYTDSCIKEFSTEYKEGVAHGKKIYYYRNGRISDETDYVEGAGNGMMNFYNEEGVLGKSITIKNDKINGSYKEFHPNGKLYYEGYYVDGYFWNIISMSDSSGRPLDFGTFKNGNGTLKMYNEQGVLTEKYEYVDGLLNGKMEKYYPNGKLKSEFTCVNDTIDGVYKSYNEDGKLYEMRSFSKGIVDGTSIIYHSNGKPWTSRTYINGLLWSVEYNYDMNGKPRDIGTLKNGNGTMLRYDENDKVIFVYEVRYGKILNGMGDDEETNR